MRIVRLAAFEILFASLVLASGCVTSPRIDSDAHPRDAENAAAVRCTPRFPDRDGWMGGDAAYSIEFPSEAPRPGGANADEGPTSLWLFGDSFVSPPGTPPERRFPFIHNSIALSRCDSEGRFAIRYFWRTDDEGTPTAFFAPGPNATWVQAARNSGNGDGDRDAYYWLFDGFLAEGALFVGLLRVGSAAPRGPFGLPFQLLGLDLARIENYRDVPGDWRVEYSVLSRDRLAFPGSTFVVHDGYLYAFGFYDRGDGHAPRMISRMPLEALRVWKPDLSTELETWVSNSRWVRGFDPDAALVIMSDDASEMSVHFDRSSQEWVAIYNHPVASEALEASASQAEQIYARTAKRLEGPWSAPEAIAEIPETRADVRGGRDPNLFCYASKAHPQYSTEARLLVTYVCNLYGRSSEEALEALQRLRVSPELYRPQTLSIPRP
jgi:hypothetical protein